MLERVTMPGIELPRLYIAETKADADLAMEKGVPFVRWKQGKDKLIAMLLMPTLKKLFPHIRWNQVAGIPKVRSVIVEQPGRTSSNPVTIDSSTHASTSHAGNEGYMPDHDVDVEVPVATSYREFSGGCTGDVSETKQEMDLQAYVGDLNSQVNLDVLQSLKLMPKFIGDIMDCIKTNVVAGTLWSEGYNKKRGATVGNFDRAGQLRNLIIVDISASIPVGISATMLTLVDTLRTQVQADLIITGGRSRFYAYEDELPSPQTIRNTIPRSNEAIEFCAIIRDHVAGNHYGHVISFGDWDCPANLIRWHHSHGDTDDLEFPSLSGTIVEEVHHYHTSKKQATGYARWCHELSREPVAHYDTSWCNIIER